MRGDILFSAKELKKYRRIFDPKALTINEIIDRYSIPDNLAREMAREMVESGKWEQVWKQTGKRTVPAYRRCGRHAR